ncbi:MAG TPA: hypothetical protein VNC21_13480 [Vicinamibacterales bacterium]|nr:hypothetical protein [Vicinamibacterales bacterium]
MTTKGNAIDTALSVSLATMRGRTSPCEPITIGVPLPRGVLLEPSRLGLLDAHGHPVPLQADATERWSDGSVRWALLDFQATSDGKHDPKYRLTSDRVEPAANPTCLHVTASKESVRVNTGPARFTLGAGAPAIFEQVVCELAVRNNVGLVVVTDRSGREWPMQIARVTCEQAGPLRATIRLDGHAGPSRQPIVDLRVRVQFFARSCAVRVAVTVGNPRKARHPGGIWELGDPGSVHLRDLRVSVGLPGTPGSIECSPDPDHLIERVEVPFEIAQSSSGRDESVRGYTVVSVGHRREGRRATPAVLAQHSAGRTALAVEHFWQNYPQAIEVHPRSFVVHLLPAISEATHEIQGGERKTYRFTLAFGDDPMSRDALFWGRQAAIASAPPAWYCEAAALPHLTPSSSSRDARYERLVSSAIAGDASFERKRDLIDEYGWRNFGDIYADHENAFSADAAPIVSHYNNQYDAIGGFATQFMRSGDPRWWRAMNELAWHVADIDIYHTDRDKAAYNHGLFWHTCHYVPAGRCTHRSYPKHPKVMGGGPANEHNYATGLRLHWLLTGDPESRDAAIGLARWVMAMDDGSKTVLRWIDDSPTGNASATQSPSYHGPGRGAGHSILALLDGHRLTGDEAFIAKAEQLIRRCIHPADDIGARELLDAERRWSYIVFMQALGRFLEHKAERGEIGGAYAYARASLLHYARWMADHEYPYLEKPAILEYPTETWAAQDIRKADVFTYAAQHATGDERARFLERAAFFFDASLSTLERSDTSSLARPTVLLLSNGFMQLADEAASPAPAPARSDAAFGNPSWFVPQKEAAKRQLMRRAAGFAVFVVVLLAYCVLVALSR